MVKAESVKAKAEPLFSGIDDVVSGLWVVQVEFWYFFDAKETEVVVWPVCEIEPVLVLAVRIVLRFLEEGMLSGTMVRDEISDDTQTLCMGLLYQFPQIVKSPKTRINRVEIRDVVPMVRGGLIKRGDPKCVDSKIPEIRKFMDDPPDGSPKKDRLIPVLCGWKPCKSINEDLVDGALPDPVRVPH